MARLAMPRLGASEGRAEKPEPRDPAGLLRVRPEWQAAADPAPAMKWRRRIPSPKALTHQIWALPLREQTGNALRRNRVSG